MPVSCKSAPYIARPVTLSTPSCRIGRVPITLNCIVVVMNQLLLCGCHSRISPLPGTEESPEYRWYTPSASSYGIEKPSVSNCRAYSRRNGGLYVHAYENVGMS